MTAAPHPSPDDRRTVPIRGRAEPVEVALWRLGTAEPA
jgi:hypothetical protein